MSSSDFSTDWGMLPPASSVRAVDGQSVKHDAEGRRRRQRSEGEDKIAEQSESADAPPHQIDRLA